MDFQDDKAQPHPLPPTQIQTHTQAHGATPGRTPIALPSIRAQRDVAVYDSPRKAPTATIATTNEPPQRQTQRSLKPMINPAHNPIGYWSALQEQSLRYERRA